MKVELRGEGRYIVHSSGWNFETANLVIDYRAIELYGEEKSCATTFKKLKVTFYVAKRLYLNVKYVIRISQEFLEYFFFFLILIVVTFIYLREICV